MAAPALSPAVGLCGIGLSCPVVPPSQASSVPKADLTSGGKRLSHFIFLTSPPTSPPPQVKDEKNIQELFDLSDYEKCEELRKSKSRSKKNHSKFTLAHCKQPGNTVRSPCTTATGTLTRSGFPHL